MKYKTMDPWEITEHPRNPRRKLKRGSKAYEAIKVSLLEFGMVVPLVWNEQTERLIGGHQRLTVIRDLGWGEVDVSVIDVTEAQEDVLIITLNKVGGEWNTALLAEALDEITEAGKVDVTITGFDGAELDKLRAESQFSDPEMEFTEELLEEYNYVILWFDNTVDWQSAKDVFGLKTVRALDSRKGYERKGIGRVLPGAPIVKRLLG